MNALSRAAENDEKEICNILATHPDTDVYNTIMSAISNKKKHAKLLVPHIKKNDVYRVFQRALKYGNSRIVKLLLEQYDDIIDVNGYSNGCYTPLIDAIRNSRIEIVKILLHRKDILVNKPSSGSQNDQQNTPLHYAVNNNSEILRLLLKRDDIDVNISNDDSDTPLHYCIRYSRIIANIKEILLHKSIDLNKTSKGKSPLMIALNCGSIEITNLLLFQKGIQIDQSGVVVLHILYLFFSACYNGDFNTICKIISHPITLIMLSIGFIAIYYIILIFYWTSPSLKYSLRSCYYVLRMFYLVITSILSLIPKILGY